MKVYVVLCVHELGQQTHVEAVYRNLDDARGGC